MSNYYGLPVGDADTAESTLKPYSYLGSVNVSTSTTLDSTYLGKIVTITAPNVVLTLPFAGTTPGFVQIVIRYTGTTGTSSVVTQGSDTISSQTTTATSIVFNPGDTVELVSNTASVWLNVSSSSASINQALGNNTDPTKGAALIGYYNGSNVKSALDTLNTEVGTNTTSINTLNSEMTSAINGINTLTNARTKYNIVATAANQRTFTVPNGYVIGRIEVFMYNTYLVEGTDYTATDGLTIYLINRKIYNNIQIGDAMTVSALIVYTTIVNPVDSTSLSSSGGATLVGYGTQTVKQALDQLNLVRTKYSIAATSNAQTTFTIPNGYIVGRLELFMYNAYLVEGVDYTATDGTTIHLINTKLYSAVKTGDILVASTLLVYSEGQNPVDSTSLASSGGASLIGYGTQTVAQALNNTILNRQDMYFTNQTTNTITIPGGYQPGFIDVYLNGVRIPPASGLYNASNGTTVVFVHTLLTTDVVECLTNTAFSFYNGVQASQLASSQAGLGAQMVGYSVGGTVAAALNALLGAPTFVQGTTTSANQVVLPVTGGYTVGTVRSVITGLGLSLQQADFTALDGLNITLVNPNITLPIGTTYTVEFYVPYVALQTQINTSVNAAANSANLAATAAAQALTVVPQVQVLDYPSLRAYNATSATSIQVTGYSGTASPSPIAGTFIVDPTDTTTADNGGTVIVGSGGKRWKRSYVGSINVQWFGATGNGTTDDTASIVNTYAYARTAGVGARVLFSPGTYLLTSSINATSVSTEGYLAVLNFSLTSSNSYAFSWGGNDTYVTGIKFQLANSGATAIQGVTNTVSNVKNQKFFGNHVVSSTTLSNGSSSIFGPWFTGTGLDGIYFYENHLEACSYGFQLNNQASGSNSVITNPLGNPTYNVFVHDNTFEDCTLGVNTPHIYCYNVNINHNNIRPVNFTLDLPLNIAHVNGLTIADNIVTANKASSNGVIHIEDVTQAFTVSGNKITSIADNTGIMLTVQSGVSQDNPPTLRGVITGNHLYGGNTAGTGFGIVANDVSTIDMTISNNYINNFGNGVQTFASSNVEGNTVVNCTNGIAVYNQCTISNNTLRGVTNAYFAARSFSLVRGGTVYDGGLTPTKNVANSGVLYENLQYHITSTTITSNTAFDVFPLPSTKFNGTVIIGFGSNGFIRSTINWDGTTFTATTLTSNLPGVLGTPTLSRNASTTALSVTVFVGGGGTLTTAIDITISGLVY